jgi:cysteine desulfurase / selenocysteine lyase
MSSIRSQFPFFDANPHVVYVDSAATSQKPRFVIDALTKYLTASVANPERGTYALAEHNRASIEEVRASVARFLRAESPHRIVFTSGCTDGLNLLTHSLSHVMTSTDEVLLHPLDHKACVAPWHSLGVQVRHYATHPHSGLIDMQDLVSKITPRTRVIVVTHSHNVFGVVNAVETLRAQVPDHCFIILDAAQTAGHMPLDVSELGVDAVAFSGHKMFAAEGTGVLWLSERLQQTLKPHRFGGGTHAFEPGTPNTAGIISLGAAITYINSLGQETIERTVHDLTRYTVSALGKIPTIDFLPGIAYEKKHRTTGIISFRMRDISSEQIAHTLTQSSICVRAGSHCAYTEDAIRDSVRVSLHVYNTEADIDALVTTLKHI